MEHPQGVLLQSVTELSLAAHAGEASVIRLCRELGFKGFQDFKLALAADLAVTPQEDGDPVSAHGILARSAQLAHGAVTDTLKVLDPQALERAAEALSGASQVLVTGQGASGVTAQDYAYKLLRLGLNVTTTADPHLAAMLAATLPADGAVIGITRSGSTIDTVHVLRIACERHLHTIAVTQRPLSPVTALAGVVLHSARPEGPLAGGSVASKISEMRCWRRSSRSSRRAGRAPRTPSRARRRSRREELLSCAHETLYWQLRFLNVA